MKHTNKHRSIVALAFPTRVVALIGLAQAVVEGLTGNQSFPNPDPSIAVLNAAIADLTAAQAVVTSTRAKGAAATRDEKRAALIALLRKLKTLVQNVADANSEHSAAIIHSVAMGVRKVSVPAKHVFSVKHGPTSGSVSIEASYAGPRSSYEWEYSADGGKTWQALPPTTRSRTALTGLQPGASYSFRYRAVTKSGPTDWTPPLPIVAL